LEVESRAGEGFHQYQLGGGEPVTTAEVFGSREASRNNILNCRGIGP
jgi:hypothetical protein